MILNNEGAIPRMIQKRTTTMISQSISADSARDVKKVAKGAGISFVGSATGRGLSILCQIIIARSFGTEVFGLYTLGLVVLRITEIVARFGLDTGAMRFVSMSQKDNAGKVKGIFISASFISFINGIVIGGIVYYFAGFVSEAIFHKSELTDVIKTFAICIPFMTTMMVIAGASQGFQTTKYSVYTKDIIRPSANMVFLIPFILFHFGIFGVIYAFVISHAIALLAGFYFISRQFPEIKGKIVKPVYEIKMLLKYSAPLLLSGFLSFLILWTDTIMLGFMKTTKEVGIYRAASQIPIFLTLVLMASNSIYAPAIAEMHYLGQRERLGKIFKTTTRWIFLLSLPIALIIIFSAREIMAFFGSDYIEAGVPVIIVLVIAQFINCATGGVGYTLVMTGKQHVEMLNTLATVIINIALNYFLIPTYGSLGSAVATGISVGGVNLVRLLEVYFLCKIQPYNMGYIQGVVCGAIAGIALYLLDNHVLIDDYLLINNYFLNHPIFVRLVSNSFVVSGIFVVGFIIKGITDEDRFILSAIKGKLKVKISESGF
ncbi:MAG TPA: flippase [Candidatus Wunengus sp. YC60]|uniref:flippase n=1 Tax=Candidatus Wunengus sp. YC60 TaxID=3367697 RepID=UPI00402886E4